MDRSLNTFKRFLNDGYLDMYITGIAGTGKTTILANLITYCVKNKISFKATAYTHKAVDVLKSILNNKDNLCTLHSYLSKVPTINERALNLNTIDTNTQTRNPDIIKVLFIDEFSMIGSKDFKTLLELQELFGLKIVYIGDPNQLPPVKDISTIEPKGLYWLKLTKIYRQSKENKLQQTLKTINDCINNKLVKIERSHETLIRNVNIIKSYKQCKESKILLAYTNEAVEKHNKSIANKNKPNEYDHLYSPTLKQELIFSKIFITKKVKNMSSIKGELCRENSKFKELQTLKNISEIKFYHLIDENYTDFCRPVIFGHYQYKLLNLKLSKRVVLVNTKINSITKEDPKNWSKKNYTNPLAKNRAKAWRELLAFKNFVVCLDFPYAMTIHKAQGSTFNSVFLDTLDLNKCFIKNYKLYLKLLYVAISRASNKVYTN